jgi:hypothetical protein
VIFFNRQKITGWILVIASAAYLAYFWRVRLMTGPLLTGKDWFNLITAIAVLIVGIANVRLAAMREQNRRSD